MGVEIIVVCLRLDIDQLLGICDTKIPGQYISYLGKVSSSAIPAVVLQLL